MNDISKRTCWVDMKQVGDRRRGLKAEGKKMPTVSAGYRLGIAGYSMQLFITHCVEDRPVRGSGTRGNPATRT